MICQCLQQALEPAQGEFHGFVGQKLDYRPYPADAFGFIIAKVGLASFSNSLHV